MIMNLPHLLHRLLHPLLLLLPFILLFIHRMQSNTLSWKRLWDQDVLLTLTLKLLNGWKRLVILLSGKKRILRVTRTMKKIILFLNLMHKIKITHVINDLQVERQVSLEESLEERQSFLRLDQDFLNHLEIIQRKTTTWTSGAELSLVSLMKEKTCFNLQTSFPVYIREQQSREEPVPFTSKLIPTFGNTFERMLRLIPKPGKRLLLWLPNTLRLSIIFMRIQTLMVSGDWSSLFKDYESMTLLHAILLRRKSTINSVLPTSTSQTSLTLILSLITMISVSHTSLRIEIFLEEL